MGLERPAARLPAEVRPAAHPQTEVQTRKQALPRQPAHPEHRPAYHKHLPAYLDRPAAYPDLPAAYLDHRAAHPHHRREYQAHRQVYQARRRVYQAYRLEYQVYRVAERAEGQPITRLDEEVTLAKPHENSTAWSCNKRIYKMKITKFLKSRICLMVIALALAQLSGYGQVVAPNSPAAGGSGAPSTPPSGNYPGTGSSPQPGVVPPALAPSGPTPGSGMGGVTNTPPSGVTPGSGASPTSPPAAGGPAAGPANAPPYSGGR